MRAPLLLPVLSLLSAVLFVHAAEAAVFPDEPESVSLDTAGLSRDSFPKGFVFGTATSAYQVEGMASKDGRGPSIWDVFVKIPGIVAKNATGEVSVDQYHRYKVSPFLFLHHSLYLLVSTERRKDVLCAGY
ncbi:hypothetical protein F2P56_013213, partial [Juglans regia]